MTEPSKERAPAEKDLKRVCVIGWPVAHSRSPLIHTYWIEKYAIPDAEYVSLAVAPDGAAQTIRELPSLGFIGANVTVPHKETAFAALDRHDAVARRLKAVNTIVTTAKGLEGRNTDGYGFIANLKDRASSWAAAAGPAVILGAGGAARAIAAALEDEGAPEIRIVNRTRSRAEALMRDLELKSAKVFSTAEAARALDGAGLLVNTTTLGMKGENDVTIDLAPLPQSALVTDIVYTPLETGLLRRAREAGHPTVDGLGMLLHQAVPGFEAWFGVRPDVTAELRNLVLADIGKK
ncbi:shikimate dehydrogenase [uncultured Parvibaculum sp.]|uniref:shikimate dehydrogenase n=1 Tax=uncultured Parvibaculum sp. TaxID=291828 RepID=UPI0030DC39D6|tara:strand:+ start:46688 stop:47566 length:879 start_codon:yes stop_codon:yes gene_type:complete